MSFWSYLLRALLLLAFTPPFLRTTGASDPPIFLTYLPVFLGPAGQLFKGVSYGFENITSFLVAARANSALCRAQADATGTGTRRVFGKGQRAETWQAIVFDGFHLALIKREKE